MKRKLSLLTLVGALLLSAAPVLADGDFYVVAVGGGVGTKITSLPYTINTPGFYYVTSNLSYTGGNGITVSADDVTIDLMGFCLSGNRNYRGIYTSGRRNVEVRNGTLKGWDIGILNDGNDSKNHRIINIRAQGIVGVGVWLYGYSNLVKGCTVSECATGIRAGLNSTVSGNQVSNCSTGIQGGGGTISNNVLYYCNSYGINGFGTISGNTVYNSSSDNATGISCMGEGNVIGNMVYTNSAGQTGITITEAPYPILMDQNTVGGPGTRYSGGSSATVWAGKSDNPWGNNAGHP